jgi:hypothetical protein
MTWKTMTILAVALAGCAGVPTMRQRNLASGRWSGEIDRDGWLQPLSLDIDGENGAYRGEWRSVAGVRSRPLENFAVQGDEVRFETDKLRFVGHVTGSTLSGTVLQKSADTRFGEFSVTRDGEAYLPGSEWAPEIIP